MRGVVESVLWWRGILSRYGNLAMKTSEMNNHAIADELASLPAEARREVVDFIVFLRQRHGRARSRAADKPPSLKGDPFLGIWAGRGDMKDSVGWARETREREWGG